MATYVIPGPVSLSFGGKTIGNIKNGVRINMQDIVVPINDDAHPQGAADYIFMGRTVTVEVTGLMWGDAASLKDVGAVGAGKLNAANAFANVGRLTSSALTNAATLIITQADAKTWEWTYAAMSIVGEMPLSSSQEATMSLQFTIVPDANAQMFSEIPDTIGAITQ